MKEALHISDNEWYDVKREEVINFVPHNESELNSLQLLLCAKEGWVWSIENIIRLRRLRRIMMSSQNYREPVLVPGNGMERLP